MSALTFIQAVQHALFGKAKGSINETVVKLQQTFTLRQFWKDYHHFENSQPYLDEFYQVALLSNEQRSEHQQWQQAIDNLILQVMPGTTLDDIRAGFFSIRSELGVDMTDLQRQLIHNVTTYQSRVNRVIRMIEEHEWIQLFQAPMTRPAWATHWTPYGLPAPKRIESILPPRLIELPETSPLFGHASDRSSKFKVKRKPATIEDRCRVCHEDFTPEQIQYVGSQFEEKIQDCILWCKSRCGQNVHRTCMQDWAVKDVKSRHEKLAIAGIDESEVEEYFQVRYLYCREVWTGDIFAKPTRSTWATRTSNPPMTDFWISYFANRWDNKTHGSTSTRDHNLYISPIIFREHTLAKTFPEIIKHAKPPCNMIYFSGYAAWREMNQRIRSHLEFHDPELLKEWPLGGTRPKSIKVKIYEGTDCAMQKFLISNENSRLLDHAGFEPGIKWLFYGNYTKEEHRDARRAESEKQAKQHENRWCFKADSKGEYQAILYNNETSLSSYISM